MKNRSEIVKTGKVIERILDANQTENGEIVVINGTEFAQFESGCGASMIFEIENGSVSNEKGWEGVDENE